VLSLSQKIKNSSYSGFPQLGNGPVKRRGLAENKNRLSLFSLALLQAIAYQVGMG